MLKKDEETKEGSGRRLQKEMKRAAIVNVVNGMSDPAQHFSFNDKVLEQVVKGGKPNQGQLQV